MPKVEKIKDKEYPFGYRYKCPCGKVIELYQDIPAKRLIKCFECIKKETT
jgi:hypothetical protein